jgi:hypothetical protein
MPAHVPPPQREPYPPPFWTPPEKVQEEKNPAWQAYLRWTLIGIGILVAACLIIFLVSVIIPGIAEAIIDSIRYFQRLFRRARFYPHPNEEFVQLAAWTGFVCVVITCIKKAINRKNKDD